MAGDDRFYTCAKCGDRCLSSWSEEEAQAEFRRNFPGHSLENARELCNTCYRELMAWLETEP